MKLAARFAKFEIFGSPWEAVSEIEQIIFIIIILPTALWGAQPICLPLNVQCPSPPYSTALLKALGWGMWALDLLLGWIQFISTGFQGSRSHSLFPQGHGDRKTVRSELCSGVNHWATHLIISDRQDDQYSSPSWHCGMLSTTARVPKCFLPRTGLDFVLPQPQNVPSLSLLNP